MYIVITMISIIVMALFFGFIAGNINENKGHSFWTGFACGALLGIIGILIVAVQKDNSDVKKVSGSYVSADELEKYKKLLDQGAITEQEFEDVKKKILNKL